MFGNDVSMTKLSFNNEAQVSGCANAQNCDTLVNQSAVTVRHPSYHALSYHALRHAGQPKRGQRQFISTFSIVCVLSVHTCVLPYKYRTMLVNVVHTDEVVRNNVAQAYDTNTMPL